MGDNNPMTTPERKVTKIDLEDMNSLITRAVILANKENELLFLKNENKTNWEALIKKYNLNPDITYDIDQSNGILIWREEEKKTV